MSPLSLFGNRATPNRFVIPIPAVIYGSFDVFNLLGKVAQENSRAASDFDCSTFVAARR